MLRVHLFGRPRLLIHDLALPIAARPKVVPLLAYLLLNRHAPLARSTVAAALWPDDSETDGRTNLRRHLHYLTGLLPPGPGAGWIRGGGGTLRWIGSPDSTI